MRRTSPGSSCWKKASLPNEGGRRALAETIVSFSHVTKRIGEKVILQDVSFSIQKGEFISVIGSSGCGKTTLLRMINALITPEEGEICVYGQNIAQMDHVALRRKIGYAIQEVGLFPHMTVRGNIQYLPSLMRREERVGFPSAESLMDTVGLGRELLNRYPAELSGGQKQRVGLARALAANPEILLMDEAFAAVDEITRKKLQEKIKELHKTLGLTIVFVTHSIKEALMLADRVFVIDGGRLLQTGTPQQIEQAPANDFVKELVCGD